jgi:DNA-binding transcriptional MerR regulator
MASSLSGVQDATIRSWETRHKAVVPFRDPKGKRFYNERELEKIKLLKLSTDLGMTISSVAKLENEEIKEIIEKTKKGHFSSTNTTLNDINLEETAQNVNLAITNADHTRLNEELKSLANYPEKVHLIDKFFPTVMKVIQEKIENETLDKEEFESITAFFKFYLTPSIFNNSESSQKVIITFFDNPYSELEVFQTALVCLENNLNVIFYNASENGKEIANHLNLFQADWLILFCGSHMKSDSTESTEIIHTIINKIEEDKKLIITGNFNYSENHFLKHKNLFPLPTIKNLDTGLKKMNIHDIE